MAIGIGTLCLLSMWTARGTIIAHDGFYDHLVNDTDEYEVITIKARSSLTLQALRNRLLASLNLISSGDSLIDEIVSMRRGG